MKPPISEPFEEQLPAKERVKSRFSLLNVLCGLVLTVSVPVLLLFSGALVYHVISAVRTHDFRYLQSTLGAFALFLLGSLPITFLCIWHLSPRKRKQKRPKSDT